MFFDDLHKNGNLIIGSEIKNLTCGKCYWDDTSMWATIRLNPFRLSLDSLVDCIALGQQMCLEFKCELDIERKLNNIISFKVQPISGDRKDAISDVSQNITTY